MFEDKASEFLESIAPHLKRLLSYARLLAGPAGAAAEELLHDSILVCHARILKRGFLGEPDAYAGYLCVVIKHEHQEQQRQATGRRTRGGKEERVGSVKVVRLNDYQLARATEQADEPVAPELDPVALAVAVHTYLIRHYSEQQVEIWEYHLKGVSFEEIGFLTGVSRSAAHRLIKKLKADLRREFSQFAEEGAGTLPVGL